MIYPRKATTLFPQICENGDVYKNAFPKEEPSRLLDLKADYTFRRLFGNECNKNIMIAFLNAFFIKLKRAQVHDFKFPSWEAAGDEKSNLTMLVETEDKESIYVDILFPDKDAAEKQSLYFWSKIYRRQFETDSDLNEQHPVITISIMNFELFHESDEFHSVFRLADKEEKIALTNMQETQFVEIPKLLQSWKEGKLNPEENHLARWLLLLAAVDDNKNYFHLDIYRELEKIAKTDKDLEEAMKAWRNISRAGEEKLASKDLRKQILEQQLLQEIGILEQKRKTAEERAELAEKNYNKLKRQYEQHKLKIAEEKMKKMEAEEEALLANREAAKIVIRYGNVVARNLFAQGMDSAFVQNITGLSDKEVSKLKLQIEEENMKELF
ncbi:Rpn family recombination-promoting nuclease/putative transposase [Oceanobacillus neutriphilus]|uniref:Transposase n=1 Tax=Oceanobacillus neutriphilus TaxID=531815 RepID=A0ABQ2NZ68_9BACI|nr:Rpn family recombination-promoting nuclease/putative transposase [Oceanobacillus neutriphilus]GGP14147.1 transposase [Oceanobacillus neutriphilus]